MFFFKKKKTADEAIAETAKAASEVTPEEVKKEESVSSGNAKLDIELTKIKAQIEGFGETRKANSERFQRVSEQIGELRGMILDSNKSMGEMEVKATKASDLVAAVQPEKLMVDVRKSEGKVEALRANIESNEAMMKSVMEELKSIRNNMKFYKGVDQIVSLNEEVKKELMEIKKVEANTKRHADKVDTIFVEVNKKFSEFDKFNDVVKDLDRAIKDIQEDFDKMKVNIDNKEDKKEFVSLLNKFNDFEKHTTNIIDLLDRKSKSIRTDIEERFEKLREKLEKKFNTKLEDEKKEEPPKEETQSSEAASAKANPLEPKEESENEKKTEETPKDDSLGKGDDKPVEQASEVK